MPDNQKLPAITSYVAEFVASTRIDAIPAEVIDLGKKSILDGLGLAIAGTVAESRRIACRHIESLGCGEGPCTIIGTDRKRRRVSRPLPTASPSTPTITMIPNWP